MHIIRETMYLTSVAPLRTDKMVVIARQPL